MISPIQAFGFSPRGSVFLGVTLATCLALLIGCTSGLPDVERPLTPTPDAPYRQSRPAQQDAWKFSLPHIEVKRLANGLHIAAVQRPGSGTLGMYLVNREAGDPWFAAKPGLASLLNRTLLEGSIMPDGRRARHLGIPESKVSVRSGGFSSVLEISTLPGAIGSGARSLAWTVKHPSFSDIAVSSGEENSFFETNFESESLNQALVESLYAQVVGENHWLAKGHRKIPSYSAADVRAEYERLYSPQYCLMIVVGDFNSHANVFDQIDSLFGDWQAAQKARPSRRLERGYSKLLSDDWQRERSVKFGLVHGLDDAQLLMLLPGVSPGKPGEAAYLLALAHLQSFRPGGIGDQLREQTQSIYGMLAERNMHPAGSETLLWVPVQPSHATNAAVQIIASLEQLAREPLSSARLQILRNEYLTRLAGSLQTHWGIAGEIAHDFIHRGSKDLTQAVHHDVDAIEAVTPADIQKVAQSVLNPTRAAILIVGPPEAAMGINRLE